MNDTTTKVMPAPLPVSHGIYQTLVLRAFARMNLGYLQLELPGGRTLEFGTQGAGTSACIAVRDPVFFQKCVLFGDIGFGESYVDGDWETDSIEQVIAWAILNVENSPGMSGSRTRAFLFNSLKIVNRVGHWLRPNSVDISRRNISEHYDLGNEFYRLWLDATMTYSSAYYTDPAQSLESAQIAKYDVLCRKLHLQSTDHLLEIGTGWGGFSLHAARHFGCRITTVTISEEQFRFARELIEKEGLSGKIDVQLKDYRHITGLYDKVASIEMMEALGDRYLETYFSKINELLRPGGLAGFQYITVPDSRHAELRRGVDWIQKHIFPGSLLLSVGRVNEAINRTSDLYLHHLEDLGASYARTLHTWWETFNTRLEEVRALGFDARFLRKWNYYLQYCEAAFASRNISVVQAIYTRPNNRTLNRPPAVP
ncbi:MAG: class SAM-dependent methyltransferase [Chthoniobacteraceae bacterium]|nr:class SAM-dependent methyltransferase [Chthoniobacteraceae bacterium]